MQSNPFLVFTTLVNLVYQKFDSEHYLVCSVL